MFRDTHLVPSRSGLCDTLLESFSSNKMHSQGLPLSLSSHLSPAISCFGLGLEESTRLNSFNTDTSLGEHTRITMKTRIAVRDKNPHRFQVIPLRDVAQVPLSQSELSSRLTVPNTPTNYLHYSSARKVSSYSQPKSMHSSSSAQALWGNNAKENRASEGRGTEPNSIKNMGSLDTRIDNSVFSLPTLPSFNREEGNAILAELDLNRPETRLSIANRKSGISLLLETSQATYKAADNLSSPSKESSDRPFSEGLKHTISQSLHVKSRHDARCLKFTSLSNIPQTDYISSSSNAIFYKMEPSTDNIDFPGRAQEAKANSLSATFEGQGNTKQGSNKRHAMYTPSLFLPYFQRLASSKDHIALNDAATARTEETRMVHGFSQLDHDRTICQEFQDFDTRLDDQDTPRRILQDPFGILPSGSIDFRPIDSPLHHSSPKATSAKLFSHFGLAQGDASSAIRGKNRLDSQSGGIVYPAIILDLFVEIDKAIEAWRTEVV